MSESGMSYTHAYVENSTETLLRMTGEKGLESTEKNPLGVKVEEQFLDWKPNGKSGSERWRNDTFDELFRQLGSN